MDRDVIKFLKFFTDLEISEINNLQNNNINELKILLANKTTAMLHGKKAAQNSEQAAQEAFSGNLLGANLPSVKIRSKEMQKACENNKSTMAAILQLENTKVEEVCNSSEGIVVPAHYNFPGQFVILGEFKEI